MKKIFLIASIFILSFITVEAYKWYQILGDLSEGAIDEGLLINMPDIKEGDIIFQSSKSYQSKAIQIATNSKYTHMGIIFMYNGSYHVFEAHSKIKYTPLLEWIKRGVKNHYKVMRIKNRDKIINEDNLKKMKNLCEKFNGKAYDLYFEWSDDKIYCSELVWKIYERSLGIEIGELKKLRQFNLKSKVVRKTMFERYGKNIPLNETVISPSDMFNSSKLITVKK